MARDARETKDLLSIEEYEALPEGDGWRDELVRGRLVREPPPASQHARLQIRIGRLLDEFVERHGLGITLGEAGFILSEDPPTVRGPDVSFIAREHAADYPSDRFGRIPPDLAVEIVSPSNRASALQAKVFDYLDAGVRLVWVVDPSSRTVMVYHSRSDILLLGEEDLLDGGDLLPGFTVPLATLFAR